MVQRPSRGGSRPGAGRPARSGPYQEPTQPLRVPQSLVPVLRQWLAYYRAQLHALPHDPAVLRPMRDTALALPLYGSRVAAGFPSPADDFLESALDLNDYLIAHPAATFLLRVAGESMTGAGIHPGDILVVDRSVEPVHDKIVIAAVNGELTVKRLYRRDGRVALVAEHPAYPPIEIGEGAELVIWGVVISVVRRL